MCPPRPATSGDVHIPAHAGFKGPPSWALDAIAQSGLSLSLAGAVSPELLGPRGQYGDMKSSESGYVCLLACTLSVLPGLRKKLFVD